MQAMLRPLECTTLALRCSGGVFCIVYMMRCTVVTLVCTMAECLCTFRNRAYVCNSTLSGPVCVQLQNEAEESAAAAAAALQQKAYVEAELPDEREYSAWLNQRHEQVSSH